MQEDWKTNMGMEGVDRRNFKILLIIFSDDYLHINNDNL